MPVAGMVLILIQGGMVQARIGHAALRAGSSLSQPESPAPGFPPAADSQERRDGWVVVQFEKMAVKNLVDEI